ncbi:hypothetical protein DSO57_1003002 [Entomophthora muscae]|uniref:Uncharacterized protein n=1 Tax=Entomophthora muscae TaxID=34485 RepID=A0ACC2SXF9_9FUNG|nr:hypothetical protein DSO57_1003002 [Entomophthora muscae]
MKPSPTPKPIISIPPTSDATGQSSQFLGVLYLALTGLIDSALPAAGPWAVVGKALSYLVKLGPIIWWAMYQKRRKKVQEQELSLDLAI